MLSYRSASSGLKENVPTCNFVQNIDLYHIIVYIAQMLCALDGGILKPNLTKEEVKALKQPKSDKDHIILTANKGVALVVMDM